MAINHMKESVMLNLRCREWHKLVQQRWEGKTQGDKQYFCACTMPLTYFHASCYAVWSCYAVSSALHWRLLEHRVRALVTVYNPVNYAWQAWMLKCLLVMKVTTLGTLYAILLRHVDKLQINCVSLLQNRQYTYSYRYRYWVKLIPKIRY